MYKYINKGLFFSLATFYFFARALRHASFSIETYFHFGAQYISRQPDEVFDAKSFTVSQINFPPRNFLLETLAPPLMPIPSLPPVQETGTPISHVCTK